MTIEERIAAVEAAQATLVRCRKDAPASRELIDAEDAFDDLAINHIGPIIEAYRRQTDLILAVKDRLERALDTLEWDDVQETLDLLKQQLEAL